MAGIETEANKYTHPANHQASMIICADGRNLQQVTEGLISVTKQERNDVLSSGVQITLKGLPNGAIGFLFFETEDKINYNFTLSAGSYMLKINDGVIVIWYALGEAIIINQSSSTIYLKRIITM